MMFDCTVAEWGGIGWLATRVGAASREPRGVTTAVSVRPFFSVW
jgi:hypothetical protein